MTYEPLYTAEEMRAAEAAYQGPTLELMERAGASVAAEVLRAYPGASRVAAWCGTGANGGDGLVVATELTRAGKECSSACSGRRTDSRATRRSCSQRAQGRRALRGRGLDPEVAVDALFGTGFSGVPRAGGRAMAIAD